MSNQGSKLDNGWTQQTSKVGSPNPGSKLDQDGFLTRNCSQLDSTGYQVRFGDNGSKFGMNESELVPCLKPSLYKQRHPPLPPCMGHHTSQPPFSCPYNNDAVNSMYKKKYEEMIYVQKEKKEGQCKKEFAKEKKEVHEKIEQEKAREEKLNNTPRKNSVVYAVKEFDDILIREPLIYPRNVKSCIQMLLTTLQILF